MKSVSMMTAFVNVSLLAHALAVPPTPLPDPSGILKNRYISMSIPDTGGNPVAIRVTLTSLMHPSPPNLPQFPPPDYSAFEGEYRWVGPPQTYTENDNDPTTFVAAQLQCAPHYADFATFGLFHVYGDAVVPSSAYDAVVFGASCTGNEATCTEISAPLQVQTGRWGDMVATFQDPNGPLTQPNAFDYATQIDKIDRKLSTPSKVRMQLQPNVPDPGRTTNVLDATYEGEAFKDLQYPFSGPTSCGAEARSLNSNEGTNNDRTRGQQILRGAPTAAVYITPVPSQGTSSYPAGTSISGQELHAKTGGFRAFFNAQISDWDPGQTSTNNLRAYEVQADASGYLSANADPAGVGGDLTLADIPCQKTCNNGLNVGQPCTSVANCPRACAGGANAGLACTTSGQCPGSTCPATQCSDPCPNLFGEGTDCGRFVAGKCNPVVVNTSRADYVFSASFPSDEVPYGTPLSPFGPIMATTVNAGTNSAFDDGQRHYLGTFALDIPSNALGRYTIDIRLYETIIAYDLSSDIDPLIPFEMAVDSVPAVVDIGGVAGAKNRYLSIGTPDRGEAYAIRVKLTSLMHPDPPNLPQYPAPDFSAYEGQYRWVGPVSSHCETGGVPPCSVPGDAIFKFASLQCSPLYSDFHADTAGGVLHLTGRDVVPSSIYDIDIVPLSCQGNEGACADIVPYVTLKTARHGDVAPPYQQPSPASLSQPDISDVAAIVDKFKSIPGATPEITAFTDLVTRSPDQIVNISDVGTCVDAFKSYPYVLGTPTDCP